MIRIQTGLQEIGNNFLTKKIVSVFADYQIFVPITKHFPTSFDDVFTIIADKDWYDSNKMFNLSLLWMSMYVIFRHSFDMWLIDEANRWKREKILLYSSI